MDALNEIELFASRLNAAARRRREFRRPLPRDLIRIAEVRGPEAQASLRPAVTREESFHEGATAALGADRALRTPIAWLDRAARAVSRASDGRFLLLVEGTEVEMNAALGAGADGEVLLSFAGTSQ